MNACQIIQCMRVQLQCTRCDICNKTYWNASCMIYEAESQDLLRQDHQSCLLVPNLQHDWKSVEDIGIINSNSRRSTLLIRPQVWATPNGIQFVFQGQVLRSSEIDVDSWSLNLQSPNTGSSLVIRFWNSGLSCTCWTSNLRLPYKSRTSMLLSRSMTGPS